MFLFFISLVFTRQTLTHPYLPGILQGKKKTKEQTHCTFWGDRFNTAFLAVRKTGWYLYLVRQGSEEVWRHGIDSYPVTFCSGWSNTTKAATGAPAARERGPAGCWDGAARHLGVRACQPVNSRGRVSEIVCCSRTMLPNLYPWK